MKTDGLMFGGFDYPQANFTRIPNAFLEAMSIIDTIGEMKVVYYILRHTWGFQDDYKKITLDEFQYGRKRRDGSRLDNGTGLSKGTIIDGLRRAEAHGFIETETDGGDAARIKKYYGLRMKEGLGVQTLDTGGPEIEHRTEKETSEKHINIPTPEKTESEAPNPSVKETRKRLLNATKTQAEDEVSRSPLAEYVGQEMHSPVPAGQCTKLALPYTEHLPGGRKQKHPSAEKLWVSDPLFAQWVQLRLDYFKGQGGSNAQKRAKVVNAICQYKGSSWAWLEWKEKHKDEYRPRKFITVEEAERRSREPQEQPKLDMEQARRDAEAAGYIWIEEGP